jgi:hypothetical protein
MATLDEVDGRPTGGDLLVLKALEHVVLPLYTSARVWVANIIEPTVQVKRKKAAAIIKT